MSWGPFHEIPGAWVVLHSNGTYKQSKVYRRGDMLFAGNGTSFIRLMARGTSNPKTCWDDIDLAGGAHCFDAMGRMQLAPVKPKKEK